MHAPSCCSLTQCVSVSVARIDISCKREPQLLYFDEVLNLPCFEDFWGVGAKHLIVLENHYR